jgi:hypothetical protein
MRCVGSLTEVSRLSELLRGPARKFNGGRICGLQSDADQAEGKYQTGTDCAVRRVNEGKAPLNSHLPRMRRIWRSICLLFLRFERRRAEDMMGRYFMNITLCVLTFLLLAPGAPGNPSRAQSCNPAVVNYIVRDEGGKVLSAAELKSVYEQLPKSIGDARMDIGEVSFADDGKSFYWPESVDWEKGKKAPSLQFANAETCTMRLTEATLTYNNKRMRLIFNIDIARKQPDRRPVIDSAPFQEGIFELDLSGWSHDVDKVIPAERWKKVKGKV